MRLFLIELGKTILSEDGESLVRYRRIGSYTSMKSATEAYQLLIRNNKDGHNLALWFHTPQQTELLAYSNSWK